MKLEILDKNSNKHFIIFRNFDGEVDNPIPKKYELKNVTMHYNGELFIGGFGVNHDKKTVEIYDINLPENVRGIGIGTAIVSYLEDEFKKNDIETIKGEITRDDGDRAKRFWEKMGYSLTKVNDSRVAYLVEKKLSK